MHLNQCNIAVSCSKIQKRLEYFLTIFSVKLSSVFVAAHAYAWKTIAFYSGFLNVALEDHRTELNQTSSHVRE